MMAVFTCILGLITAFLIVIHLLLDVKQQRECFSLRDPPENSLGAAE
jgi:hypothetical protein